jgi:hypothetical protein
MTKIGGVLDAVARAIILLFAGLVGFALSGSLFILFFVLIVGGVIWDQQDKIKALEKRLSKLEKPPEEKTEQ